jgi:hypothetical protein
MNQFLPDGHGSDWATRWHVATASAPFAPRALDVKLIRAHARFVGGPTGFVCDLDPHGLHTFGALHAGTSTRRISPEEDSSSSGSASTMRGFVRSEKQRGRWHRA